MVTFLKPKIEPKIRNMINKYDLIEAEFSRRSGIKDLLDIARSEVIHAKFASNSAKVILHVDQAVSVLQNSKELIRATLSANQGDEDDSA